MSWVHAPLSRNVGLAAGALLASSATLICCVLPAVLVTLGAGAALAGLVSGVPQLIWLSEHKTLGLWRGGALLVVRGVALCYAGTLPCPPDPAAARACRRLRLISRLLYGLALASF